ncbi:hypothetical protein [Frondihabitans cladoniiphilus]|uniref:Tetratricopeptide repeat protein n=1 Tax=Frondihabitans cladoniiphilus TaxID=715785 RepID=A0ABP8W795_9MICO
MSSRHTSDEVIERALRNHADGNKRSAYDSLRAAVRRNPSDLAVRRTLVGLSRQDNHPDQAARWGALEPELLEFRELRLLRREIRHAWTDARIREILVLSGDLPPALVRLLPSEAERRSRRRSERGNDIAGFGILAAVLGSVVVVVGVGSTVQDAFAGASSAQSTARWTVWLALAFLFVTAALLVIAGVVRRRRRPTVLAAVLAAAAVVGLVLAYP